MAPVRTREAVRTETLHDERGLFPKNVRVPLEALPSPQEAAVVEHVFRLRVHSPVVALARVARFAGDLDKAVVERQVVADGVLPRRELLPVIWEAVADEFADAAKREFFLWALQNGHCDKSYVRIRRLHQTALGLVGGRSTGTALALLPCSVLALAATFARAAGSALVYFQVVTIVARFGQYAWASAIAVPLQTLIAFTHHVYVHVLCCEHRLTGHVAGAAAS